MAKMRSPNYPAIGLGEAVQMARDFWGKEKRTAVSEDVAAKALGYSSLSGPARTRLAALKKYGLLESDSGNIRLSDLAMKIVHPGNESELEDALAEAALRPELFADLFKTHGDASDNALASYLIRELEFSDIGAKRAIGAFRDTLRVAKLRGGGYSPQKDEAMSDMEVVNQRDSMRNHSIRRLEVSGPGIRSFSWPVSRDVTAEVRFTGGAVKSAHLEALAKYLELAKIAIESQDEE